MSSQVLWFATRAAGVVTLLLLSAVVVMGLLARLRVESPRWPRFLTAELHGQMALMTLVFLGLHIITAVVDPYTSLGIIPVLVPFGSWYRTLWLGLGTVAFELLLAIVITSLLRVAIGARFWRGVHWLAYAAWPVAVLHGIGTGSDSSAIWMIGITAICVVAVLSVALWRLATAPRDPLHALRRHTARTHQVSGR